MYGFSKRSGKYSKYLGETEKAAESCMGQEVWSWPSQVEMTVVLCDESREEGDCGGWRTKETNRNQCCKVHKASSAADKGLDVLMRLLIRV